MTRHRPRLAGLLVAMLLALPSIAHADYYVVVGEHSPVNRLSTQQVLQLFMGRTRAFPDGSPASPCDIGRDTLRDGFYRLLTGMSLAQVNSYWARLMFSGRNLPPLSFSDPAAMIARLQSDPGAIGWLPEAPRTPGLKTVLVLRSAP